MLQFAFLTKTVFETGLTNKQDKKNEQTAPQGYPKFKGPFFGFKYQ